MKTMIDVHTPISKGVLALKMGSTSQTRHKILDEVDQYIELIKANIDEMSLMDLSANLLDETFKLKLTVLQYLAEEHISLVEFNKKASALDFNPGQVDQIPDLAQTYTQVLSYHSLIMKETLDSKGTVSIQNSVPSSIEQITFSQFQWVLNSLPAKENLMFSLWIEQALKLDFALVLAGLVLFEDDFRIPEKVQAQLDEFLMNCISKFGAYMNLIGLWNPKESQTEDPIINRMLILAATIQLEYNLGSPVEESELKAFLTSN